MFYYRGEMVAVDKHKNINIYNCVKLESYSCTHKQMFTVKSNYLKFGKCVVSTILLGCFIITIKVNF